MIATPYLVTIGLGSIVGFVDSLWLVLWDSIPAKEDGALIGWTLVGFISGGILFVASGMLLGTGWLHALTLIERQGMT